MWCHKATPNFLFFKVGAGDSSASLHICMESTLPRGVSLFRTFPPFSCVCCGEYGFMCEYACLYMLGCTYGWMHMHGYTYGSKVDSRNHPQLFFYFTFWGRASQPNLELIEMTGFPRGTPLPLPSEVEITVRPPQSLATFKWVPGVWRHSPCFCSSTSTTQPYPAPRGIFWLHFLLP